MVLYGKKITVNELVKEVNEDRLIYETSGGGVTISGGEPLLQPHFTSALLEALKKEGYQTALDTCGYAEWEILEKVLRDTDLVLYDLKLMDAKHHEDNAGVTNEKILSNLKKIANLDKVLIVRVPVIPGVTDSKDNFGAMAEFLSGIRGVDVVELLPYHDLGVPKYAALGRKYILGEVNSPDQESLKILGEILENHGIKVTIEGWYN